MSNVTKFITAICLAGLPILGNPAFALAGLTQEKPNGTIQEQIFADVQKGVAGGSVQDFSSHFGSQVYIQLPETEGAHYSARQAFYVLDLFLQNHKTLAVSLSPFGLSESNPYATGKAIFVMRGVRQDAHVYVALSLRGEKWMISHLSIR
jgi:hypothetical protein